MTKTDKIARFQRNIRRLTAGRKVTAKRARRVKHWQRELTKIVA